jgi:hypothetical protein
LERGRREVRGGGGVREELGKVGELVEYVV